MKTVVSQSSSLIEEAKFGIVKKLYNRIVNNPNNQDDLQGRLHSRGEYEYQVEYLQQKFDGKFFIQADKYYFHFQDPEVENICEQYFSGDSNGCTLEDIQNIYYNSQIASSPFRDNTNIEYFNELNQFTKLTTLPAHYFRGCTNLKTINLENITRFNVDGGMQESNTFSGCSSLEKIYAPNLTYTGVFAFNNCTSLKYIVMPLFNTIARTDGRWIQGCNNLEYILLGKLQKIEGGGRWSNGEFNGITNLKVVDLGDNLNNITELPFKGCSNMKTIIIRNTENIPTIEDYGEWGGYGNRFGNANVKFFVSDNLLNDYKTSSNWIEARDHIYALSTFRLSDYIDFDIPEVADLYNFENGG